MSLSSWKKEFYRIPASQVSKGYALRHSLRKWIGLKLSNRKRHEVSLKDISLINTSDVVRYEDGHGVSRFVIGWETCALCLQFDGNYKCEGCPLDQVKNGCCKLGDSPYNKFEDTGQVSPMIRALERAQKKMRENR